MFTTLISSTLVLALAISGAQAAFSVNSPELTQCKDAKISWSKTSGPYNLIVVPNENPCEDIVADLRDHSGTSVTWKVNVSAGRKVLFSVLDESGEEAWSEVITVKDSDDASCLPGNHASSSLPVSSPPAGTPSIPSGTNTLVVPSPSNTPQIVGAAAAGDDPLGSNSGAPSVRQFGGAAFAITALAAVAAVAL